MRGHLPLPPYSICNTKHNILFSMPPQGLGWRRWHSHSRRTTVTRCKFQAGDRDW
jgi:hypothetical protein